MRFQTACCLTDLFRFFFFFFSSELEPDSGPASASETSDAVALLRLETSA